MTSKVIDEMHTKLSPGTCTCGSRPVNFADFLQHSIHEAAIHDPDDLIFNGCEQVHVHDHEPPARTQDEWCDRLARGVT